MAETEGARVADNGLEVKKGDIWDEILRHPNDLTFFCVDADIVQSVGPDRLVFVQSKSPCSSGRIQINLNTWALAKSSTLGKADLDKLLDDQKEHYVQGILHRTGTNPIAWGFATFIHDRAAADRSFSYERAVPLCTDLAPEPGNDGKVWYVDGHLIVRGRYYVSDANGECNFTVKTVFFTNGDQRDATLTLDPSGRLSGDVKSPIAGAVPSASAAPNNSVEISDESGQPLAAPTGKAKSDTWTNFRLQTTLSASPFGHEWPLGFDVDAKTAAKGSSNTTLVLIGSMEIVLEPQHSG